MNEPIKTRFAGPTDYLKPLQDLGEHIKASKDEMLRIIDNDGEYEERFNIKIEMNGKSAQIELHADAFDRIMGMIEDEITEYIEMHGSVIAKAEAAMMCGNVSEALKMQDEFDRLMMEADLDARQ